MFASAYFKFLLGSLALAGEINGEKDTAISLLESSSLQGNIQALTTLGLIFADGSDVSYDCKRSTRYFSDEAFSRYHFQVFIK